jgi:hypothetical protein
MVERPSRRLQVIAALVTSLILTLVGRLYYVQVLDPNKPQQTAGVLHDGRIVVPAPRGEIVDARGRPLVDNRVTHVVTVDRESLQLRPDRGAGVLSRLASLLGVPHRDLAQEITPCGVHVPSPCWTGEPYQPVPVVTDASTRIVLALSEHREKYPGVNVETQTVRNYPDGTSAAHLLGYTGAVSATDEKRNPSLQDADTIGRSGRSSSSTRAAIRSAPRAISRRSRAKRSSRASTATSSDWPNRRSRNRSRPRGRTASRPRALPSSSWTRTPGASSRQRAIRATTRRCSSAGSPSPTTRSSPHPMRTTRSSTVRSRGPMRRVRRSS